MVICLERGADLHMFQLMPLTVSCFSKIQIGFAFLVPAHLGSPGKRAVKRVCVCVCVCCTCFLSLPVQSTQFCSLLFSLYCISVLINTILFIHSFNCGRVARSLWKFPPRCLQKPDLIFFTRPHALPREEYIVFRPYTRTPSGRLYANERWSPLSIINTETFSRAEKRLSVGGFAINTLEEY